MGRSQKLLMVLLLPRASRACKIYEVIYMCVHVCQCVCAAHTHCVSVPLFDLFNHFGHTVYIPSNK